MADKSDKSSVLEKAADCNQAYDVCFRNKVEEALLDTRPAVCHKHVMSEAQAIIDRKRADAGRAAT